jgi:hypothetical protein
LCVHGEGLYGHKDKPEEDGESFHDV